MQVVAVLGVAPVAGSIGGVVTVRGRTASCTCHWRGRRRFAVFLARHDAWMHAALYGCRPGVPLVVDRVRG